MSIDPRHRPWLVYASAVLVAMAAFMAMPPGSLRQDLTYDAVGASAAAAVLIGVHLHRPVQPWTWRLLALGQLSFFIGDLLWVIYAHSGQDPFPSLADVFYLAGYPIMAVGLVIGIRNRLGGGDQSGLLDAAILTTGVAVVAWTLQIGPLAAALDPDPLAFAISLAYPVMDVLLIGVCIGLLAAPGSHTASFRLLALSLVALLVADQVYAIQNASEAYTDGSVLDLGWLLAYGAMGASALHPSMSGVFQARPVAVTLLGPLRLVFLAAAMLTGPALLVFGEADPALGLRVIAGGTVILSILVLGRLAGLVRQLTADIDKRRALEAQLSFQATHDPLTYLANRRLFVKQAEERLASRSGGPVTLMFLDIDDFKTVNDSLGHQAGDDVLVAVGNRIRECLRDGDLAARLGGDEFAVLLRETTDPADAEAIAARMALTLAGPLTIEGTQVPVAASIGIAVHAPAMADVDALMRAADLAMYGAKARGKDRYLVYTPELDPGDDRVVDTRVGSRNARTRNAEAGSPHRAAVPQLRPGLP